jgi:DNA invertase Pin-like site-specific DNA recombinase
VPVLGYVLVRDFADHNGDGFRIDADAIDHACEARGLRLIELVRDREANNGESAPRPGLSHALERVAAGEAGGLVVARLEHLGSSATELGTLIERVSSLDARLIAADQGLDTGTDRGRRAARTLASISRLETDEPAQRTHPGMAPAPDKDGQASPTAMPDHPELADRIAALQAEGKTLQASKERGSRG